MNEIDHFKAYVFYSGDVTTDMDHLHVRKIISIFLLYSYRGFSQKKLYRINKRDKIRIRKKSSGGDGMGCCMAEAQRST
jgi:hypothetical protein